MAALFVGVALLGAGGHRSNPFSFVLYLTYPICFLTELLKSLAGGPDLLWLLLCFLASLLQYFLIGLFIDRRLQQHRHR